MILFMNDAFPESFPLHPQGNPAEKAVGHGWLVSLLSCIDGPHPNPSPVEFTIMAKPDVPCIMSELPCLVGVVQCLMSELSCLKIAVPLHERGPLSYERAHLSYA